MHQGATPFFEKPVTTGDPEAFVHGVRPSSVSNLSAQPPRFAMRSLVWPSQPRLLSWGDVVPSMVLEGTVWRPHPLHTAEATGSKPVTPTREKPQLRAPTASQADGALFASQPAVFRRCSVAPRNNTSKRSRSAASDSGNRWP
jgi:hypothetical protein